MPFDIALVAAGFLVGLLWGDRHGWRRRYGAVPDFRRGDRSRRPGGHRPGVQRRDEDRWRVAAYAARTVDFVLVKRLALGSVPAGLAAVALIRLLPSAGVNADQAVKRALGAVLILVALVMLCRLFARG
jgi:hypothetical protein